MISGTGFKQCALSPPGFYGPSGTDVCMPCPSSLTFGDNGFCVPSDCNSATTCSYSGKCMTTPPGYYSYEGTTQCMPCPSATQPGSTSCPLEQNSVRDCSAAGQCVAGGVCGPVPVGFYSPAGIDACIVCAGSKPGATSCPSCSAAGVCFTLIPGTTLRSCGLAPPGYYGAEGEDNCMPCSSQNHYGGFFCDVDCTAPTECLYGGKCQTTPAGYYSYAGTSQCIPCPTAGAPGSTSCPIQFEQATPCAEAGKCIVHGECKTVPAGFYSPKGVMSCLLCCNSKEGAKDCPFCSEAGRCFFILPGTDIKQCGLSPPGYFGPLGTDDCQPCPSSTTFGDNGYCAPTCDDASTCLHEGSCSTTPAGYGWPALLWCCARKPTRAHARTRSLDAAARRVASRRGTHRAVGSRPRSRQVLLVSADLAVLAMPHGHPARVHLLPACGGGCAGLLRRRPLRRGRRVRPCPGGLLLARRHRRVRCLSRERSGRHVLPVLRRVGQVLQHYQCRCRHAQVLRAVASGILRRKGLR